MGVLGIEQAPAFHLPVLMDTYGQPGSVWVNAYSGSARNYGPRQVTIHVFYPKLGFMAQYDAPGGEMVIGILRNCFVKGPSLHFLCQTNNFAIRIL